MTTMACGNDRPLARTLPLLSEDERHAVYVDLAKTVATTKHP